MSSLEKHRTGRRGSMQGHRKYSDGFSDTSSSGSFMDETDREVSNLTDRAFRSLCIGEEAIYNDSEFSSSPTEWHKAFAEKTKQRTTLQRSPQETFSYSVQQYGESEMTSTFQHSYVDVKHQEQALRDVSLSYNNNGSKEMTWQQGRSASRVSSLIKAFSTGECYQDSGTGDVNLTKDMYRDFGNESLNKSALISIQRELSEISAGNHQNFKSGPFQSYRNHFSSDMAQMDTTVLLKSSISKSKAMLSKNSFFHSEFSPFQLWEEYNRFPFEKTEVSGFMSASEFPRWYDSPMYKELKDTHKMSNSPIESRSFNQRQIQDVVPSQRSRSTVIQKASAIEKRCESEMASNCPPWKNNNSFVRSKLPSNRPSTVSPTNEKKCRPDSSLFSYSKVAHDVQRKVVSSTLPSSMTPFNITKLLTPVIHTRQETETSEILQFAHTPSISDYCSQGETDPKPLTDAKHLSASYKTRASHLLFNLKDNRKRVKSTYSPTRFKGLEITDRQNQTAKLEGRESRFSDILVSQETPQENFVETDMCISCNQTQEHNVAPITHKNNADAIGSYDNLTLTSPQIQDGAFHYKSFCGSSDGLLAYTKSTQYEYEPSSHNLSTQDKSSVNLEGQLKDLNSTFSPTNRPEIASILPKSHQTTHSLPAQTLEQHRYSLSDNVSQNDLQKRMDFGRKTDFEYSQNEVIKERCPWEQTGSVNSTGRETSTNNGRSDARPFRGEIAALIEMDKQRKATAKQYLPTANDSFSVRKETYMRKVNDDIKLGRLGKEEEKVVREDTISRKNSYHDNPLNRSAKPIDPYSIPKNIHQNKISSPPKKVNVYGGLQSCTAKNDLEKNILASERGPEQYASINSIKISDQSAPYAPFIENKCQKNEGSYQPYRYEPNKQWHIASTSEDKNVKDSVLTLRQSESYKVSKTSSNTQPNTLHATMVNQNELSTKDISPNPYSVIPTIDNSDQNNPGSPNKSEDRFSINDILAIRDKTKRIKENTYNGNLAKSENPQNQIKHDIAENKATISEIVKEQEQTTRGYKIQDSASPAPGSLRKDFHNANEGLANINTYRKDRLMSKDNDKVTTRAISFKERGQSKQEILTSKLKAHAQKEILAIKEKGLVKQGILARNATKPGLTVNIEKSQDGQEIHCVKKEITAEKLNHLFQDITYSSVTQYKDDVKTQNDYPMYGSPPLGKKQPMEVLNSQEDKSEYIKSDKHLATEMQNESVEYDRCPDDDKVITKAPFTTSNQDGGTTVRDLKHKCKPDVQKNKKNYQPAKISKDEQICRTSSEDIHPNERFANQSLYVHGTSPSEMMPGSHLTLPLKTENYISHNPPALCVENQKVQPDQKEKAIPKYHPFGSAEASRLTQYAYTEEALTKPTDADTIRKDERPSLTNTEIQNANSGINENSQKSTDGQYGIIPLGLDRNTQRVKEDNVHHKSRISAAAEQSENEFIKNSSRISASQLTSTSSDINLNTGIPLDKLLTESAKSELISKCKANTMDAEQIKNAMYKHNSGVNSDVTPVSSTKNIVKHNNVKTNDQFLQRTEEKEKQKQLVNEDGTGLISKNNTRMENDLAQQQSDISPVKAVETTSANQTFGNQSESRQTELIHMESVKESYQQKELLQDDENTKALLSVGKNDHLRSHQNKSRTKDESEAVKTVKEVSREKTILGSACSKHIQAGKGGGFYRSSEKNPKSTNDYQEVDSKIPGSPSKAKNEVEDPQEANASTQNTAMMQEGTTQKFNDAVLTPSKEEPIVEPMIYSICVSSKTETAKDDEPMIFSICVSSKCHIDEPQNPVNHEEKGSAETEVSAARCVIRSEENESIHDKSDHQTSIGQRETELSSNNRPEKELPIKKPEPQATDKQDCYKVSDVRSISSSYEDLLAKYGLRDHGYATSKQHMQDKRKIQNTEESETLLSQKPMQHEINRSLSSNEKSSDTQIFPKDSRQTSDQPASLRTIQLLKETASKTMQQAKQHSDSPSITHSDYKAEKKLITGNDRANLDISTSYIPLVPTDTANAEQQDQDSKDTEAFNRRNHDVQSKDKTFEEQVRETEIVQGLKTENNADDGSNSRMSPMKTENVFLTAKQPIATGDSKRTAKTAEVLKTTISKASVAKDTLVKTKPNETTNTGRTIPHNNHKPQKEDTENKMLNHASDSLLAQKHEKHSSKTEDQKILFRAKQENTTALAKESVSVRDGQALQNSGKGDVGEKTSEQGQVGFNTSNEITDKMNVVSKDGADTHVNNYLGNVYSIGVDVCTVVKQDQTSSEVSKIHFEDIKESTKEVLSNEEFMADHKKQHAVIKIESLRGNRGAVVTAFVGENFSEQNESRAKSLITQNEPETKDNMKGTSETTPKRKDDVGKEITPPPKKDSPMQAPMLRNIGEDSTSDLEKTEVNLRGGAVRTQEIKAIDSKRTALNSDKVNNKDLELSSPSGHNDNGNLKVDENRCSLRGKKQINGDAKEMQASDQYNTNQYQQGEGLVPETKGNADEQGYAQFSKQGIGRESILSKPEATQRGKKVTRPEILAIADYARLKVISVEEDDTKEIDIIPKLDIYNSHDLPVLGIRKHLHKNVPLLNTVGESKTEVISNEKEKGQIFKQRPLHFQDRGKESFLSQKQNHSNPSISTAQPKLLSLVASRSEDEAFVFEGLGGTQDRALINHKESNTKPDFMEQINRGGHHKMYPSKNPQGANILQSQAHGKSDYFRSKQLSCDNAIEKDNLSHSGKQNLPLKYVSGTMKTEDNPIKMISPAGEEMDELQYYTVNYFDRDIKPKETPEPSPLSHKMTQNKILSENLEEEKNEDSFFLQSLIDYSKVNASGPHSNSSSPSMGKPAMFRVKDNTIRNTSVIKTVKPCFHRSFSDDFRIGSPKEHLSGTEKGDEENFQYKESAKPPILHDPAIASHRLHKVREALQNNLPLTECTAKQSKGLQRRSQILEDEETLSIISTMSEDVENCSGSIVDMSHKIAAYMPKNESYRDTYQRSASACYDRPESACYERPESACSDMRQLGKPPAVPPKSEKALRRAQRLTTRRKKKTETQTPESQEQQVPKSIQNISIVPSSPSDMQSTPLAVQVTPPLSHYGIEPNYTTPVHSMVAQPFPMTHRKLLQDPNSGHYFMVDMPLTVKTKTFYDPETGKYVQLNVRQRSQVALTQPASVEMLNAPYVLYPGFVPMAASSSPAFRSSSQMSVPAKLTEEQDRLETGSETWRQNVYQRNNRSDSQQYPEIVYRSYEQIHDPSLYTESNVANSENHTDIITMSELEDFAMENT